MDNCYYVIIYYDYTLYYLQAFPEIHPGRLTWNLQITHLERNMIFQTSMVMFHVNLPGCRPEKITNKTCPHRPLGLFPHPWRVLPRGRHSWKELWSDWATSWYGGLNERNPTRWTPSSYTWGIKSVNGRNPAPADVVDIPCIHRVLDIPGGCLGFLPSTVNTYNPRRPSTSWGTRCLDGRFFLGVQISSQEVVGSLG